MNELYAQLQMPVYGIYKVADRQALREFEKVVALLEKSTPEDLANIRKLLRQRQVKK